MPPSTDDFQPGQRVAVTQQIPQRGQVWTTRFCGVVVRCEQKKTGAWFAGARHDRLWLDRLLIQKEDGELVTCILDQYTHVEKLTETVPAAHDTATGLHDEPGPDVSADASADTDSNPEALGR